MGKILFVSGSFRAEDAYNWMRGVRFRTGVSQLFTECDVADRCTSAKQEKFHRLQLLMDQFPGCNLLIAGDLLERKNISIKGSFLAGYTSYFAVLNDDAMADKIQKVSEQHRHVVPGVYKCTSFEDVETLLKSGLFHKPPSSEVATLFRSDGSATNALHAKDFDCVDETTTVVFPDVKTMSVLSGDQCSAVTVRLHEEYLKKRPKSYLLTPVVSVSNMTIVIKHPKGQPPLVKGELVAVPDSIIHGCNILFQ